MFPIAGQTAGPNGLTFFVDTLGSLGGHRLKENFFLTLPLFHGQRRALQVVKYKIHNPIWRKVT